MRSLPRALPGRALPPRALPILLGGAVVVAGLVSACGQQTVEPDPAPDPPATSVPPPPPSRPPIPGLRPLNASQKQQRDLCQSGIVKNGCEFWSDDSLLLQGYDPQS